MPDFEAMYFRLAARTADAVELLDALSISLKAAQREAEETYITDSDKECGEE